MKEQREGSKPKAGDRIEGTVETWHTKYRPVFGTIGYTDADGQHQRVTVERRALREPDQALIPGARVRFTLAFYTAPAKGRGVAIWTNGRAMALDVEVASR